ncbi:MAG TPA: hypothetical protein VH866_03820 [Candidatus Deferrimicrobiaceae bacterium]|jgi:hypothetical protein
MKFAKLLIVGFSCIPLFILAPASFADADYQLVGGSRAHIEGKKLVLVGRDSRRSIAPDGRYFTRDGMYSIVVKGDVILVRDHTKEAR